MTLPRMIALTGMALALLAGCAPRSAEAPRLMNIAASQRGPDEFSILPSQPLQAPPDFRALPAPTPGAANLVDTDPRADAARALGGRPQAVTGQVPAADSALLARTARFGADGAIRETLAAEDVQLRQRRRGRPLERLFGTNMYARAYEEQLLDRDAELRRWRAAGARTPAAPPPPER
jgi:hypothetical protein